MNIKTTLTAILLSAATLSAAALTDRDATYRLTLNSIPAGSSWYQILDASDWSSPALDSDGTVELRAGAEYHVMTFPDEGFVFREWCVADTLLTPDRLGMFTMPAHDATMTGRFEYDPASPPGPGSNHWNPQTGELIIDEFKPGYLSSAIYQATGGSPGKIHALTVAGKITDNDYQAVARCGECTFFDFSRTTGASSVPGGSFANSAAETVILPASTEWLLGTAMYGCRALTSLTIHSLTPPLTGTDALKGVPDGLIVYVPAAALEQYRESPAWSGFTLLPITADIRSVTVTLPDETAASDYKDMWLELVNTKSGQRIHYVMTGRTQYTFANIIRDTSWEIILRNERGDIFGRIDNVEVKDEDVSVSFVSLSKPQNVMLTILTPEGNDVTDETKITWTDASGNYMSQGASLAGLPAGGQVNYSVALSQQLAMSFVTPSVAGYVVQDGDNNLSCRLAAVGQTSVSGRVTDAATGMPLDGATVSASQTFGGRYTKTVNARTDRKGLFTLDIADVPTTLAFAASDYVSKTMTCDPLSDGTTTVTLPDVALSAITGATVSIGFTYTTCSMTKSRPRPVIGTATGRTSAIHCLTLPGTVRSSNTACNTHRLYCWRILKTAIC